MNQPRLTQRIERKEGSKEVDKNKVSIGVCDCSSITGGDGTAGNGLYQY
jgi:hypothetical protein